MYDANALKIYIDGSAITNPGDGVGCAGVIKFPEELNIVDEEISWSYNIGTNNAMELSALVNATRWLNLNTQRIKELGITRIIIISDSNTVVDGANKWVYNWRKDRWKKTDGGDVKNRVLWKKFLSERGKASFHLDIFWQKNKSDEPTKRVDRLAKEKAGSKIYDKINSEYTQRKACHSLTGSMFLVEAYPTNNKKILIRVYYHFLVNQSSFSDYEVRFEEIKYNKVVGRFKAFCSWKDGSSKIDRYHYYYISVLLNDKKYPKINKIEEIMNDELQKLKDKLKVKYKYV